MNENSLRSALIRPRRSQQQPQMHWQKHSAFRRLKTKRNAWLRFDSPLWPVILLLIVMLLAGCHTQPTNPCVEPAVPTKPASLQPIPNETYSLSVQRDLSRWEQRLTVTPAMSKP